MANWTKGCGGAVGVAGFILSLGLTLVATPVGAQTVIAGVKPDQRPESAPRIQSLNKPNNWYAKATAGVVRPVPPSLKFLDDQGGWFTPFDRPGMPGRYDIRKLHRN